MPAGHEASAAGAGRELSGEVRDGKFGVGEEAWRGPPSWPYPAEKKGEGPPETTWRQSDTYPEAAVHIWPEEPVKSIISAD